MGDEQTGDIKQFRQLLKGRPMKTSARNHLWGGVTCISDGSVNAEITLALPRGKSVCAIFKASTGILCLYA